MKIDKNTRNNILVFGGVIAGYFLVIQPILRKLGLQKTKEEKAVEQKERESVKQFVKTALKKQNPTKSAGEWALIANTIYEDLRYSAIDDNKADAGYQIARVQNDADVAVLIEQFGKRQEYFFGIPTGSPKTLPEFITSNLSRSTLDAINGNYQRKNIKFRY
jgi:hypothetical protein